MYTHTIFGENDEVLVFGFNKSLILVRERQQMDGIIIMVMVIIIMPGDLFR